MHLFRERPYPGPILSNPLQKKTQMRLKRRPDFCIPASFFSNYDVPLFRVAMQSKFSRHMLENPDAQKKSKLAPNERFTYVGHTSQSTLISIRKTLQIKTSNTFQLSFSITRLIVTNCLPVLIPVVSLIFLPLALANIFSFV